jgi:hypothetical protein
MFYPWRSRHPTDHPANVGSCQKRYAQEGGRHVDAGHAAPPIARASRTLSGSRFRRGKLRDDEHARRRSLKGRGVYREWMDLPLTPKGATMDISTFLVFIVGLGAMLAAELAP